MYSLICDKVPPAKDGSRPGICKCYLNRANSTLHVIGGIYAGGKLDDNRLQAAVNCAACTRYHKDIPLLTNMCG